MSCRHDLANGTCLRCYPESGNLDPGPEDEYESNLEGPGAVTLEEHLADRPIAARVETATGGKIVKVPDE